MLLQDSQLTLVREQGRYSGSICDAVEVKADLSIVPHLAVAALIVRMLESLVYQQVSHGNNEYVGCIGIHDYNQDSIAPALGA